MKEYLTELLIKHEGLSLKPYLDTAGKLTIGVGRNLDDCGITEEEARFLLENDVNKVIKQLQPIPTFNKLTTAQQMALADMVFNLGFKGVLQFKKMWAALEEGNFHLAATEMLNSKWAKQVPVRAKKLSQMLLTKY